MSSGVLLIDKPQGLTSHDVVDVLRKKLNIRSIGHGGTLDPLATGLLVCLVGEATKLSQYVMTDEKVYEVHIKLGVQTDSGDITGEPVKTAQRPTVEKERLDGILKSLTGPLDLPVPKYSAVKVQGKKLYEYARKNEDVVVPIKTMLIHDVKILSVQEESGETHGLQLEIRCEKGTYIRSWVEELGKKLESAATVEKLRRLRSGPFSIDHASNLEELGNLIPLAEVLPGWPALRVADREEGLMRNGQIPKGVFSQIIRAKFESGIRVLTSEGGLLALVVRDSKKGLKVARVFSS